MAEDKKLNPEVLENVVGGAISYDPGMFRQIQYVFTPEDVI